MTITAQITSISSIARFAIGTPVHAFDTIPIGIITRIKIAQNNQTIYEIAYAGEPSIWCTEQAITPAIGSDIASPIDIIARRHIADMAHGPRTISFDAVKAAFGIPIMPRPPTIPAGAAA